MGKLRLRRWAEVCFRRVLNYDQQNLDYFPWKIWSPLKKHHPFLETLQRARHDPWPFPYIFSLNLHYSLVKNYLEIVTIILFPTGNETKGPERGRDLSEVTEMVLGKNQDENSGLCNSWSFTHPLLARGH